MLDYCPIKPFIAVSEFRIVNRSIPRVRIGLGALGICLWKSSICFCTFFRWPCSSQVLSEMGYPFHLTKYCNFPRWTQLFSIFSTSYSSAPSTRSGGGSVKLGPCASVSLYGMRSPRWNTSWIFQRAGRVNRYITGLRTSFTAKGPYRLGARLNLGYMSWRFFPSNQTLSSLAKVGTLVPYLCHAS